MEKTLTEPSRNLMIQVNDTITWMDTVSSEDRACWRAMKPFQYSLEGFIEMIDNFIAATTEQTEKNAFVSFRVKMVQWVQTQMEKNKEV